MPKHGGCYVCGSKEEEILSSRIMPGQIYGVALCTKHENIKELPPKPTTTS